MKRTLYLSLSLALVGLTACGGGSGTDDYVQRSVFAVGDQYDADEDAGEISGDVSTNDRGDDLSFALASGSTTANGTLVFNTDGTFTYTPNENYHGKDPFQYVATNTATGETATATATINVANDFETIEEYGWSLSLSDEFEGTELDAALWESSNVSLADGVASINGVEGASSFLKSLAGNAVSYGRVEASIQLPAGSNLASAFSLLPVAYNADENQLSVVASDSDGLFAGAHYGLNLLNGVRLNAVSTTAATEDFRNYAIEWDEDYIRFYLDGVHIHSVDTLNTWTYTGEGESLAIDQAGPYNGDMLVSLELNSNTADPAAILVDYIRYYQCDPNVSDEVENCASAVDSGVHRLASDRIESLGQVVTPIYIDEIQELSWHYTDEVIELGMGSFNDPVIEEIETETERGTVIDVTSEGGDANISFTAPNVEYVGSDVILHFSMYIDSSNTLTETFDLRMETVWPYMGMLVWNTADLELDTWVNYSIPVQEFLDNPFLAPDWLNWIPGVGPGDPLPLDPSNVGFFLTIEFHDAVHIQIDNVALSCISNESCIQGPMAVQAEVATGPHPLRFEAEDFSAMSGIEIEATADEGGGDNIGFIDAGDFVEYNILFPYDGTYTAEYRLASSGGSEGFDLLIDGMPVDNVTVPDTGDWQAWATHPGGTFDLTAGEYTVRFDFIGGATNINWFQFIPPAYEIHIEAENWDDAGEVQTEATADEGGGENVGYIDAGDFLEYSVDIPADGTYTLVYRLASQGGSDGFETSLGGEVVDARAMPDTGGWQNWISVSADVELTAGVQTLRMDFIGGSTNVNWIKITN